ncbi:MAG: modification methylase PaeR7I [Sphingomonas sp.]|nr:MAG: modification methylase PaeR7I [Sphingomonas sp.]
MTDAIRTLADAGVDERGAIFTRREVADFVLDLIGYTVDKPLHKMRLLEPSFGDGDFLLPAVERLVEAWRRAGAPADAMRDAIRAVELHGRSYERTHQAVQRALSSAGISEREAEDIADVWLLQGDYLLTPFNGAFDAVIGNPPYVRQESIPDTLIAEYRRRFSTIFDRADLYVPFIERSLTLLKKGGQLGFICADRWMKNRYGGPLRGMVARSYHLKTYVDMVGTDAFHAEVVAYPAITIIAKEPGNVTRLAYRPKIEKRYLAALSAALNADAAPAPDSDVKEMTGIANGSEPWVLDTSAQLALVRRLERDFPTIEEARCRVGIGVATGADQAFIGPIDALDVEDSRKLPLVMTRDIERGSVEWRGLGVVNPFGDNGKLVDLATYPKLRRYLEDHRDQIAGRHVAQKAPANWYRTIDRIYPELTYQPKLLIPDIKGGAHIVYEKGCFYPHHNLYFITSRDWDLQALQTVLMSGIARLFVAAYSTKMRGGFLRFQAQYLRRIRLPHWDDVPAPIKARLVACAEIKDEAACNAAVYALYGMTEAEIAALKES